MKLITFNSRAEWLEWRFYRITGTDAPAIMETSPFMSRTECWAKKVGKLGASKQTPQMKRGLDLEAIARARYEKITGNSMPAFCAESTEYPFLGVSGDGINLSVERALEIKCPGKQDHELAMSGKIPRKYLYQLVHTCLVTGLPYTDYFSYSEKNGEIILPFKRDFSLEEELLSEEIKFQNFIEEDVPPEPLEKIEKLLEGTYQERMKNVLAFRRGKK